VLWLAIAGLNIWAAESPADMAMIAPAVSSADISSLEIVPRNTPTKNS
jgi:hypothetical protein